MTERDKPIIGGILKPIAFGIFALLVVPVLLILIICQVPQHYKTQQPAQEIEKIEIVHVPEMPDFNHTDGYIDLPVICLVSPSKYSDLLDALCNMPYHSTLRPGTLYNGAIRITYHNGNYEIICEHAAYYHDNTAENSTESINAFFNSAEFDAFLKSFGYIPPN